MGWVVCYPDYFSAASSYRYCSYFCGAWNRLDPAHDASVICMGQVVVIVL